MSAPGLRRITSRILMASVLGSVVGLAVPFPTAEAAVPPCVGDASNYFSGGATAFSSNIFGARATIELDWPLICGPESTSLVWAMAGRLRRVRVECWLGPTFMLPSRLGAGGP